MTHQESGPSQEVPKPINPELRSQEKIRYQLNQRYADARLNLSGQDLLDEIFDISNEYRDAGMLKEAGEMLLKAEEIESGSSFQLASDKELDVIAGVHAKTVRQLTEEVEMPDKKN